MHRAPKELRADAQRNYDAIVAAATRVFARGGVNAPLEDVASEAGVGQGTLYRHFPTREHLFATILRDRVAHLDARARELLNAEDASTALAEWLRLYDRIGAEYRGMSALLGHSFSEDGSPMAEMCAPMRESFRLLFAKARKQARLRRDVTADHVLATIASLPKHPTTGRTIEPLIDVVLAGLRS